MSWQGRASSSRGHGEKPAETSSAPRDLLRRYGLLEPGHDEAFDRIVRLAARLLRAPVALLNLGDGTRLWCKASYGLESTGVRCDESFCRLTFDSSEAVVVPDAIKDARFADKPMLRDRPDLRFYAGVPLCTPEGINLGALCILDTRPRSRFSDRDRQALSDLGGLLNQELQLRLELRERRQAEAKETLLAEAGAVLGSSLDDEATLAGLAQLAVPSFADWCIVDLLDAEGGIRRVKVAAADPQAQGLAQEAGLTNPPDIDNPNYPIAQVLRTGRSLWAPSLPGDLVKAASHNPEDLRLLQLTRMRSFIVAPLARRDRVLGTITFILSEDSGRHYDEADLTLAEELARRAALAMDNALLHHEVQLQRDQLKIILDGVAEGITAQDRSGRLLYVNTAAARASGYPYPEVMLSAPIEELQGRFEVFDEEGAPFPFERLPGRLALQGKDAPPVILRFTDKRTGETRWSSVQATPMMDDTGEVAMAINIVHDLTELKRAEEALRERERRYQAIFDTAAVSIWEEDFSAVKTALDGLKRKGVTDVRAYLEANPAFVREAIGLVKVLDVNQAAVRMLGARDKAELLGSLEHIFVSESMDVFMDELVAISDAQSFFAGETGIRTLAGEPRDVIITITLPQATGTFSRVLVSIMDITERKRAEGAVRRSEERYRTLATVSSSIVWRAAPDGRIADDVYAWQAFTGQTPQEYRGWGWLEALHPDDREPSRRAWQRGIETLTPIDGEFRLWRGDGQYRRMEVKGVPIRDEEGAVVEWIGTCTDVEDQRRALEEQRRRELEEILTAHSTKEKRRIARDLHDGIRQQLVGIRMLAANLHKKLEARALPEAGLMDEFARLVGDANTQVRELIHDLAPSQVEADGLLPALERSARNIEQWYGVHCSVVSSARARAGSDDEANHLFHIAQEAMTNAAKHSRATEILVDLRMKGGVLRLEIRDDGIGLPEGSEKRGGMGLANMRYRAELIGGTLEIKRGRHEGTKVVCMLGKRASRRPPPSDAGTPRS